MVHNGIEYGDMQLIAEAYDVLKNIGGLTNEELHTVFTDWNNGELSSFLVEITSKIFAQPDDQADGLIIDKILDKTGMKGTGKWTVQQAAELSIAAPTIAAALDSRIISGNKDLRVRSEKLYSSLGAGPSVANPNIDKQQLIEDVRKALYASKICSYAQGMNIIRAKSLEKEWNVSLGECARIWKGGCIIRAVFLDRIKQAYDRDADLDSLLMDMEFAQELVARSESWRRVVALAVQEGVGVPGMMSSLAYFDNFKRGRLPANLVQAQRDFFGSHTYQRVDDPKGDWFHTVWPGGSADSITTSAYNR
jgi:6-phosphogluconate dehydrogenase